MNADLVKQQPFLDERLIGTYAFYKIPKTMLTYGKTVGIGTDETLLYSILRDRLSLSLTNGKVDDEGRIYIYYSREKAAECLGWSIRKTINVFKALTEHGLLSESEDFTPSGKMLGKRLFVKLWQEVSFDFTLADIKAYNFRYATEQTLQETSMGAYYSLPMVLVEDERYTGLALRSILVYMILLDRITLSKRYGRVDENGLLWTTLDRAKVADELGFSPRTLTSAMKDLEDIGLIERKAVEYSERWRIYVRDFSPPPIDALAVPSPTPQSMPEWGPTPTSDTSMVAKNAPLDSMGAANFAPHGFGYGAESAPLFPSSEAIFSPQLDPADSSVAKNAPQCGNICTPMSQVLHGCEASSAPQCGKNIPAESQNLQGIHPSYIQPSLSHLSKETNLPAAAQPPLEVLSPSEQRMRMIGQVYLILHYDETLEKLKQKFRDTKLTTGGWGNASDKAESLLNECCSLLQSDLLSLGDLILVSGRVMTKSDFIQQCRQGSSEQICEMIGSALTSTKVGAEFYSYLRSELYDALLSTETLPPMANPGPVTNPTPLPNECTREMAKGWQGGLDAVAQAYDMIHFDDVLTLIYTRLEGGQVQDAAALLEECCSIVEEDLSSRKANIIFGRKSIPKADVIAKYQNLNHYVVYLLIQKVIPLLGNIKDLRAYLHWGLYTAKEHHAGEAFHLRKELGNP